jgi:hypothetical protein
MTKIRYRPGGRKEGRKKGRKEGRKGEGGVSILSPLMHCYPYTLTMRVDHRPPPAFNANVHGILASSIIITPMVANINALEAC